jgi:hypothetical protein
MSTVLLTGLPRSGTTLVCALLNEFPDTLALGEPLVLDREAGRQRAVADIRAFVDLTRVRVRETGLAMSKHVGGSVPDNWMEDPSVTDGGRLRRTFEERGEIAAGKPLSPGFRLVIKHPAEFTALADLLRENFPLFALVRHPLAVLASWQTVAIPVHHGHMPMLEAFTPGLTETLDAVHDRLARQVMLMAHLLGVYASFPPGQVLRYEDVVADPAVRLSPLSPHSRPPLRVLREYDPAERYRHVDLRLLSRALLPIFPSIEPFYPDIDASLARHLA